VLSQFAGVSASALRYAQAGSVFGTRFPARVAGKVAGLGDEDVERALDALVRNGLVTTTDPAVTSGTSEVRFVHGLFVQALYEDLVLPVRAHLHRRAFYELAACGRDAEAAQHVSLADLSDDAYAITVLERAGSTALHKGAVATAVRHLRTAAELAGPRAGPSLLFHLGEALLAEGNAAESVTAFDRVLQLRGLPPSVRVRTLRLLARAQLAASEHELAATNFQRAAQEAEAAGNAGSAIDALLDDAVSAWWRKGPAYCLPRVARARELIGHADATARRRVHAVYGWIALLAGNADGLADGKAACHHVVAGSPDPHADARGVTDVLYVYGLSAVIAECFGDARRILETAMGTAESRKPGELEDFVQAQALLVARVGPLDEALRLARRAEELAASVPVLAAPALAQQALILLHMGRFEESEDCCDRAEPLAVAQQHSVALLRIWHARALRSTAAGQLDDSCHYYDRIDALAQRLGITEPCLVPWARHAVLAYTRAGHSCAAARVIGWLENVATRLPCRWPAIAAAAGRAAAAEEQGEFAVAEEEHRTALALHDGVDLPIELAETLTAYGSFLRRRARPRQARQLLAQAVRIAEQQHAGWIAGHAREELSVAGGRRRRVPDAGHRLTAQEHRIARLASTGASNRDIAHQLTLSVKTVEYHLQQVYTKLAITSRRSLIANPDLLSPSRLEYPERSLRSTAAERRGHHGG
jgi:DNA-binding CsgD family transcriptional regulator